jgi:hypothetical protein
MTTGFKQPPEIRHWMEIHVGRYVDNAEIERGDLEVRPGWQYTFPGAARSSRSSIGRGSYFA